MMLFIWSLWSLIGVFVFATWFHFNSAEALRRADDGFMFWLWIAPRIAVSGPIVWALFAWSFLESDQ